MFFSEEFANSILIIDDHEEEVKELKEVLEKQDLYVLSLSPDTLLSREKINRKDLVFLDFMLNDEDEFKTILSKYIRPIFEKHFKKPFPYGIVIWTKHDDYVADFYARLKKDSIEEKKYTAPLFVIALDKNKYLKDGNYSTILDDIEKKLSDSFSANFLITWKSKVLKAIYWSVADIFHLINSFDTQDDDVKRIVYKLAINRTGLVEDYILEYIKNGTLSSDAYKAFDELLYSNLNLCENDSPNLFVDYQLEDECFEQQLKDVAGINTKILLDTKELDPKIVIPGNVYWVKEKDEYLIGDYFPKDSKKIAIELTPPCDFSQGKKKYSKLIGGFIKEVKVKECETVEEKWDKYINKNFKGEYRYLLWPLKITDYMNPCLICFDFHCEKILADIDLTNSSKFELLYRTKTQLFADILQKYSSNKARLGLAALKPNFKKES